MRLSYGESIAIVGSTGDEKEILTSTGGVSVDGVSAETLAVSGASILTGPLTVQGANDHFVETLQLSSGGVSPSSMTSYGLSVIDMTGTDPSTAVKLITLAPPIVGVKKNIVFNSTVAYANTIDIDLGAGVGVQGSTTNRYIYFSTLAANPQAINLVGITTALWSVLSVDSTIAGGFFGAATGIRSGTAVRTT
jgi:hypothetical protein